VFGAGCLEPASWSALEAKVINLVYFQRSDCQALSFVFTFRPELGLWHQAHEDHPSQSTPVSGEAFRSPVLLWVCPCFKHWIRILIVCFGMTLLMFAPVLYRFFLCTLRCICSFHANPHILQSAIWQFKPCTRFPPQTHAVEHHRTLNGGHPPTHVNNSSNPVKTQ